MSRRRRPVLPFHHKHPQQTTRAPQVLVIREGPRPGQPAAAATTAAATTAAPAASTTAAATAGATAASGPLILGFGVLLPQRESLQVVYMGLRYEHPLVRQSNAYFQVRVCACVCVCVCVFVCMCVYVPVLWSV